MKSIEYYWYQSGPISWLLLPLSWLYCLVVIIRRKLYQLNIKKSHASGVPVVVVGNIVAGGSGKTPLLISLCEYLLNHGHKPGVVSRGYGGRVNGVKQLDKGDSADMVGDEPLMIYQRTNVPVVVGADRVSAINCLLENNPCDVILSDDGMQHYRMRRNFEIAVVDSVRKFGNGFCLPSGPLREPVSRLQDVDMLVFNGCSSVAADEPFYTLEITGFSHLKEAETKSITGFRGKAVHAVAGIGHPARFFQQMRENGLNIVEHPFPDHYSYSQEDFSGWNDQCIIMTEKDAVKCRDLLLPDAWAVIVVADFSDKLESQFSSRLLPVLN